MQTKIVSRKHNIIFLGQFEEQLISSTQLPSDRYLTMWSGER